MPTYIVTIKSTPHSNHDPQHKKTGRCVGAVVCTDASGAHHSFLVHARNTDIIKTNLTRDGIHVTRIEKADNPLEYWE